MPENLEAENPVPAFAVGDAVQWMQTSSRGTSMSFGTRHGKIVKFSKPQGLRALVKQRNGRQGWVSLTDLRSAKAKSPVNEVFEAMTGRKPGRPS